VTSQASLKDDCSHEGLECSACVEIAARNLSAVCVELEGKSLERMYLRLYTKRGCRKMLRSFESRYQELAEETLIQIAAEDAPVRTMACCA
jgi:hypothetical protein